jgi:hypothetical protein
VKKLWNDPVWSKVIASVIFAAGTAAVYSLLNWWSVISPLLARVFAFASSATPVPNWFIGILVLLLPTVALFKAVARRPKQSPPSVGGVPHQLYLQRQEVHWIPFKVKVRTKYWVAGTSLVGVAERAVIEDLDRKGVKDIKLILPAIERHLSSFIQLDQYDKLVATPLVNNQVKVAGESYKKLLACVKLITNGKELDHIRLYSGIMYSNITIFDDDAFIAFYDSTGVGDNNITLHFNQLESEVGYRRIEEEFMKMWNSEPDIGKVRKKRMGASILFLNSSNQVLLFLRDNRKDISFPNYWDILEPIPIGS